MGARQHLPIPTTLGDDLLMLCRNFAAQPRKFAPIYKQIRDIYALEHFRALKPGTVETLVGGFMAIKAVRYSKLRVEKLAEYERRKRHSPSIYPSRVNSLNQKKQYRDALFKNLGWLTSDYLDRLETMLVIGFMQAIGDKKITKATWYPLIDPILLRFLLTPELNADIKTKFALEGLPKSGIPAERLRRIKNNIRSRVSYLARTFFGGEISTRASSKLFREVQRTMQVVASG